jgi:divalent metal cation (Fe/Co/Zn/Cd) transporter
MAAIEVVQKSIETLVAGYNGSLPDLDMTPLTIGVLVFAIAIKLVLWSICARIAANSSSADALAQDHRNDVFSNSVAVTTSLIAHYRRDVWYTDSLGAIAISVYIGFSWLATGKEQVERLIGLGV